MSRPLVLAIIPARYASTRFPGKPLALLNGKEIILHVAARALRCKTVNDAVVATDDQRIFDVVVKGGFKAVMTKPDHPCGTDRIAEVAEKSDAGIIVNIQGDEPMIDTVSVDRAVQALLDDPALDVATLAVPITHDGEFENPNAVKVVMDNMGNALYFSRAAIPYNRGTVEKSPRHKHLGLYVYRKAFLLKFSQMEPGILEQTEQLEQLRILQHGVNIRVIVTGKDSIGIDTPEDLKRAEALTHV